MNCEVSIFYETFNTKGESLALKRDFDFGSEDVAKAWLAEAHAAAKVQDQQWILSKVGYAIMGPLERIDFQIGNCICTWTMTKRVDFEIDYQKKFIPYRVLMHDPNGSAGAGRFSKFRG